MCNLSARNFPEFDDRYLLPAAEQLFHMFRSGMDDLAQLTRGSLLGELAQVYCSILQEPFKAYLHDLIKVKKKESQVIEFAAVLLNTIDYVLEGTKAMSEIFKKTIQPSFRQSIDFYSVLQTYEQLYD